MSNKINSTTAGAGGLENTAHGDDGILLIQSDGVTVATFNTTGISGDGSQLTNLPAGGGLTLLSTLTTTSGTEVTTATLNLTTYKTLIVFLNSVGNSAGTAPQLQWKNNSGTYSAITSAVQPTDAAYGFLHLDLATGVHLIGRSEAQVPGITVATNRLGGATVMGINNGFTTSTTEILFTWSGTETFDSGTIKIYGLK